MQTRTLTVETPLPEFYADWYQPTQHHLQGDHEPKRVALQQSASTRRKYTVAINHLARLIERPPVVGDLTADAIAACVDRLLDRPGTARATGEKLAALARAAQAMGVLVLDEPLGDYSAAGAPSEPITPWAPRELSTLLAAARTMPGDVDGIAAGHWWPAFLLLLVDSGATVAEVLAIPRAAYDHRRARLPVGSFLIEPHSLVVEALEHVRRHDRERLLPWPLDGGRPPFFMLYRAYRRLLFRARLPGVAENLFGRLQVTAQSQPGILDLVDPSIDFTPREGEPTFHRSPRPSRKKERRPVQGGDGVYSIAALDRQETLAWFFEELYLPRRLAGRSANTPASYRAAIRRLCAFAACEVTCRQLSDDLLERYAAWLVADGRTPATVNRELRVLLALWRFAWRKRFADDQPRDVELLPVAKRVPRAWSLEELGRLLAACDRLDGRIGETPAADWWRALLGAFYDTGLRLRALLLLDADAFDPLGGWIRVPAELQKHRTDEAKQLHPDTIAALARLQPVERVKLFPSAPSVPRLRAGLRGLLKAARLPHTSKDLFHKLRRTHATHLAAATDEATAQASLGHSSIQVTKGYYIDPRFLKSKTAALPRPVAE